MYMEFCSARLNVYKVSRRKLAMYIEFYASDRQCAWNFGSHRPMYIEFWWRPLSTLLLWVGRRKMAIALCAPDPKSTCRIWWRLNRRNNSTVAFKCHFFLRLDIFELQLSSESLVRPSLNVYKFFAWSGQCVWSLRFVLRPTPLRFAHNERQATLSFWHHYFSTNFGKWHI